MTTTKKAEEELPREADLHAVRTAEQTVVVHRYRQRVCLFAALRYPRLVHLPERSEAFRTR